MMLVYLPLRILHTFRVGLLQWLTHTQQPDLIQTRWVSIRGRQTNQLRSGLCGALFDRYFEDVMS